MSVLHAFFASAWAVSCASIKNNRQGDWQKEGNFFSEHLTMFGIYLCRT